MGNKIPFNKIHNFIVYEIIDEKDNVFKNEDLPLLEWAKENNFSYTALNKIRKNRTDIRHPYNKWKLKKLYLKRKHFQKDDSYLYILFNLYKPGEYIFGEYKFNYEPFYIGSGTYTRIFDYNKDNMINKSEFSEKYNLIRLLYEKFNLEDFTYILKISKNKLEIDQLEKDLIKLIGRKVENSGPLLNILDGIGQMENTIYLATTNYPEKLKERILNRPSRFDRRYKIEKPDSNIRKFYFEKKLRDEDLKNINLDE
jgi:hypothetical protein